MITNKFIEKNELSDALYAKKYIYEVSLTYLY